MECHPLYPIIFIQTVDPRMAQSAIASLVPGGQLMTSSGSVQGDGASLSQEQQSMLFRHQAAIAELLRHFWSCFPARTPQLEEKVHYSVSLLALR